MEAAELLNARAREYEVLAASHIERAPLGPSSEHLTTATAFMVAAIVLREVAYSLDEAA